MTSIQLPYGRGHLCFNLPEERLAGIIESRLDTYVPQGTPEELVARSMEEPIGTPRLEELAKGKENVVLLCSDHTRPVPSRAIVPQMLAAIRRGNPQAQITLLIATGWHRGTTPQELEEKFGPEIAAREKIVVHDCADDANMVHLGTLPSGGQLYINRLAAQADLLVAEGFIEPHFFAGFSGGRKSVLPGVASRQTVYANHCSAFIDDPHARAGILEGNPIHRDMVWAARKASLAFIVNAVIDSKKRAIASFAGDCEQAHLAGTRFLASLCQSPSIVADVVVTSNNGYPLDQNIYQAVKGMSTAEVACREGGVIIMAAQCADGIGGDVFYETFLQNRDAAAIMEQILAVPQEETVADQWQSQVFARVLMKCKVIFVSDAPDEIVKDFHMIPAHSMEEALAMADRLLGREGTVTVIPEGISSILTPPEN